MSTLEELREQMDEVDDQIAKLYRERMHLCDEIGAYKVRSGVKVLDRQREREKLMAVIRMSGDLIFEYDIGR